MQREQTCGEHCRLVGHDDAFFQALVVESVAFRFIDATSASALGLKCVAE